MKGKGKGFEGEVGRSLKRLCLPHRNSNGITPLCDYLVWHRGEAHLIECKEVRSDIFPLKNISEAERSLMTSWHDNGLPCWIVLRRVSSQDARAWICAWGDWLELEHGIGYEPNATTRRAAGTASISLEDGFRSPVMQELELVPGQHTGLLWDLSILELR